MKKGDTMSFRVEADRRPLGIKVPQDIIEWLEIEAVRYGGSVNAEIVRTLRMRKDAEERERKAG
jgi:hypothetical protein